MCWAEIDKDKKLWTIPGARTKNHREHIVPLSDVALSLITASLLARIATFFSVMDRVASAISSVAIRAGRNRRTLLIDELSRPRQKAAKDAGQDASQAKPLPDWRLHDLRRTAATVMADQLGVLPHIIEAILNHVSGHRAGVAGIYNRASYEAEMRAALGRWADHIVGITS